MAFVARWAASLLTAVLLWPVILVVWHGPDRDFGYVGGAIMLLFIQFISPAKLWIIPLGVATFIAIGWEALARRKSP